MTDHSDASDQSDGTVTPADTDSAVSTAANVASADAEPRSIERPAVERGGGADSGRAWLRTLSEISQVVGSIGVVVSLLYVGQQLHLNTRQLQREENNATQEQWQTIRLALAADPGVADVWNRGLTGERLDDAEQLRFEAMLEERAWATFHIWIAAGSACSRLTSLPAGPLLRWLGGYADQAEPPGGRRVGPTFRRALSLMSRQRFAGSHRWRGRTALRRES